MPNEPCVLVFDLEGNNNSKSIQDILAVSPSRKNSQKIYSLENSVNKDV